MPAPEWRLFNSPILTLNTNKSTPFPPSSAAAPLSCEVLYAGENPPHRGTSSSPWSLLHLHRAAPGPLGLQMARPLGPVGPHQYARCNSGAEVPPSCAETGAPRRLMRRQGDSGGAIAGDEGRTRLLTQPLSHFSILFTSGEYVVPSFMNFTSRVKDGGFGASHMTADCPGSPLTL